MLRSTQDWKMLGVAGMTPEENGLTTKRLNHVGTREGMRPRLLRIRALLRRVEKGYGSWKGWG